MKPDYCPFCGNDEVPLPNRYPWVRCNECGVETSCYETVEQAVKAWNTRTTPLRKGERDD